MNKAETARGGWRQARRNPRRLAALAALALMLVLLLALNGFTWIALNRLQRQIERLTGERLIAFGAHLAGEITPDKFLFLAIRDSSNRLDLETLRLSPSASYEDFLLMLSYQREAAGLRSLMMLSPGLRVVADPQAPLKTGEAWEPPALEREALMKALRGEPSVTPLASEEGQFAQRAYVPVWSAGGTILGALRLEAGERYFAAIVFLRRALAFSLILLTAVTLAGAAFIFRLIAWTADAERAIARADRLTSLGSLAAGLAHEIRNPLAVIRLTCEELRSFLAPRGQPPPPGAQDAIAEVEDIKEEVARLESLVGHFLALARPGAAPRSSASERIPADPAAALRRTARLFEKSLSGGNVRFRLEIPESAAAGARVALDEPSLTQALVNLLRNAAEALPPEGGEITLSLAIERGAAEGKSVACIAVADTGRGMDAETARQVFEPFFTTKEAGIGLGLALTRQIITAAGGEITLESAPGRGTTVFLRLPVETTLRS